MLNLNKSKMVIDLVLEQEEKKETSEDMVKNGKWEDRPDPIRRMYPSMGHYGRSYVSATTPEEKEKWQNAAKAMQAKKLVIHKKEFKQGQDAVKYKKKKRKI